MNYPSLPDSPSSRRPPRNSNFFFLFILGFMAFFLFMQYQKAIGRSNTYRDRAEIKVPDISSDGPFELPSSTNDGSDQPSLKMPSSWGPNGPVGRSTNGDWEVDMDVETDEATSLVVGSEKGGPESVSTRDWSLEVGESTPSPDAAINPAEGDFNPAPQAKSTTEGDWELGEVETVPGKIN